ncbi:hypothetical protein F0562_018199 [Nyssa sinensis]|uniref:Uncharacterized protein n=1 Tax=Nyssa sinensis TaxID=561372 RepID=A0A5J4ZBC1_9ASTE|nr:hypothetical protein F0562_018199 [Nyssa sinensis]
MWWSGSSKIMMKKKKGSKLESNGFQVGEQQESDEVMMYRKKDINFHKVTCEQEVCMTHLEDDIQHVEVNFYVRGLHGTGRVYTEMFGDKVGTSSGSSRS